MSPPGDEARARLDVWLWRARFAKTRAGAARLVAEGGVRLVRGPGSKVAEKPALALALGDVLLVRTPAGLRQVRVAAFGARRGPATEARGLYEDLQKALDQRSLDAPRSAVHVTRKSIAKPARDRE